MSTIVTTFLFLLLVTLITLFLSTIRIYLPPTSSAPHIPTEGSATYHPITPPTSDFLFRVGELQVYGRRTLFLGVVIGTSILAVVVVGYIVLGLRRPVEWDMSEQWRAVVRTEDAAQEESWSCRNTGTSMVDQPMPRRPPLAWKWNRTRNTTGTGKARVISAPTPRPTLRASFYAYGSRPSIDGSSRRFPEPRRGHGDMLAPHRRQRAQARALSLRRLRKTKASQVSAPEFGKGQAGRDLFTAVSWDRRSGYEIPSYYLGDLDNHNRTTVSSVYSRRTSAAIPSYHATEHDEDGNSITEGQQHMSYEMREWRPEEVQKREDVRKPEMVIPLVQKPDMVIPLVRKPDMVIPLVRKPEEVVIRAPAAHCPGESAMGEISLVESWVESQCASLTTGTTASPTESDDREWNRRSLWAGSDRSSITFPGQISGGREADGPNDGW